MAIIDYYSAAIALDQNGRLVRDAEADVYALSDTTFSTPLAITDLQGVPMAKLRSNSEGLYPDFRVVGDVDQIVAKSGDRITPMTSLGMIAADAEEARDEALAAVGTIGSSVTIAETARDEALAAAYAAGTAGAGLIEDPLDPGTFITTGPIVEDPEDPGFYTVEETGARKIPGVDTAGRFPSRVEAALVELILDTVGAALVPGTNVTITVDDIGNSITIAATGGGGGGVTDPEVVRDTMATALQAAPGVTVTANDTANSITIGLDTDVTSEIIRDTVAATLVAGTGVSIVHDDANNIITVTATGGSGATDPEIVRDTVAATLVAGANITITPNDTADTITIAATGGGGGGSGVTGAAFGLVFAEDQGVNGAPVTDRANWATSLPDNSSSWPALLTYAHTNNLKIYLRHNRAYDIKGLISNTNQNVRIIGGGTLVTRNAPKSSGYYGSIRHNPETVNFGIGVSAFSLVRLSNDDNPSATEVNHQITLSFASNLNKFKDGDVWRITANNVYPWANETGGPGANVWRAEQFDVLGVLFPTSGNTAREGDTIVGATSGATGVVGSVLGTSFVVLKSHTGTFTSSETYRVGGASAGTMAGVGKVLVRGQLDDTLYSGTITLAKMRTDLEVELDVVFDTLGDPEQTVGDEGRNNFFELYGLVRPKIKVKGRNAWGPMIFAVSCDRPDIHLDVWDHVNNASTASTAAQFEGAYGYGIEIQGSTRGGFYRGSGTRMRHWFTTNPLPRSSYPTANDVNYWFSGMQRRNDVSADVFASYSSALDTHIGASHTYFHDSTISTAGLSAGRHFSGANSLSNRSANTTYERIRVTGPQSRGFSDLSLNKNFEGPNRTRMIDCYFDGTLVGGLHVEAAPNADGSLEVENTTFVMTTLPAATVGEGGSTGIDVAAGNYTFKNVRVKNASYAAVNVRSGLSGAMIHFDGFRFDIKDVGFTSPYMIRLAASGLGVWLHDIGAIENGGTWASNRGAVHVASGNPTIRRTHRPFSLGNTTALPVVTSGSASHTLAVINGFT